MHNRWLRGTCLIGLVMLLAGCASPGAKLVGVWEMVDERGEPVGKKKILTEDHFAFGAQTAPAGIWAGGGTWKLVDDVYFETVEYHSMPGIAGMTLKFDCRIIDGLWYHEGSFRNGDRNFVVNEVWRRFEDDGSGE